MTTINPAAGIWAGLSTSGTSATFSLPTGAQAGGQVAASCAVTGVTGSTPSLQLFLDVSDVSGNWFPVVTLTAQTTAGVQTGVGNVASATANAISQFRLRWTLTGTNPVFNVMAAAFGC